MKQAVWLMILSITYWTLDRDQMVSYALAPKVTTHTNYNVHTHVETMTAANGEVITATKYTTDTRISYSTQTGGPSENTGTGANTSTQCHTGGGQYGGGQWNYCNRDKSVNQDNTQEDTKDLNDKGANKSTMLGMAAIAAGMAMVAAGMSMLPNPPTAAAGAALIAAGMALIAAGMAALAAAKKMNNNANKANTNAFKMDNLTPSVSTITSDPAIDKIDLGKGSTSGIKIDPALLRTGKMDAIFTDMELKTGLSRDDFANGMRDGMTPLDMLAGSPSMQGTVGGNADSLQKMMDSSTANGVPEGSEMMSQLGLNEGDLGGYEIKNAGGAPRGPAAASVDSFFPTSAAGSGASGGQPVAGANGGLGLSPDVQAALDKNGITGRTIFEMVRSQYVKKTPLMFGVTEKKIDGTAANPYQGLDGKIDL